jgi:hypothetical protein
MKRNKRVPLRRAEKSIPGSSRHLAAVESVRGVKIEDVPLGVQPNEHQTPAWVLRMREKGIDVREPRPGAVIGPFKAVPQAGALLAFWRRAVRRLRDSRAVS